MISYGEIITDEHIESIGKTEFYTVGKEEVEETLKYLKMIQEKQKK